MTLTNLYNFEEAETLGGTVVRVPRGMLLENYLLKFCLEWDTGGPVVEVPLAAWREHDEIIGVWAPELQHEGGVRGVRADRPGNDPAGWEPPIAPNRPLTDPYKPLSEMEADVRRRTAWGFVPLRGFAALQRFRRSSSQRLID